MKPLLLLLCTLTHFITVSTESTPAIDSWGALSAGISSNQMTTVVIPPAGFKCRVCEDVARTWRNTFQCVGMGENSLAPRYALSLYGRRSRFLSFPFFFFPCICPSLHLSVLTSFPLGVFLQLFVNGCCAVKHYFFRPSFSPFCFPLALTPFFSLTKNNARWTRMLSNIQLQPGQRQPQSNLPRFKKIIS